MNDDELDRRSAAEAAKIRAEAAAIADTDAELSLLLAGGDPPAEIRPGYDPVAITSDVAGRHDTRWLAAAAAALLLVVAAAVVVFAAARPRGDDGGHTMAPASLAPSEPPASAATNPTSAPTTISAAVGGDGWYVPTWTPDGYRIAGASAVQRDVLVADAFTFDVWIERSDSTGSRRFQWLTLGNDRPESSGTSPDAVTVRGVPASVFDGDGEVDVQWSEAGRDHRVSSALDRDTTLAAIEAATIGDSGVTLAPGSLPTGFEWVDPAASDEAAVGGPTTVVVWRDDSDGARSLTFNVSPNEAGYSLDRDFVLGSVQRRDIGGVARNVQTRTLGDERIETVVTWYADGYAFYVDAVDVDPAIVERFVAGITKADQETFLAFEDEITARGLAGTVFDQATFADGLSVALRSPDGEAFTAADSWKREGYLCVDAQPAVCSAASAGGSSSSDDWKSQTAGLFDVDGHKTYLLWGAGTPNGLTIIGSADPPDFFPSQPGAPGMADAQLATGGVTLPFEQITGTAGTFVRVEVPDDVTYVTVHSTYGAASLLVSGELLDRPAHTTTSDAAPAAESTPEPG